MRRVAAGFLFLFTWGVLSAQNPAFDSAVGSVLAAHGGPALDVTNARLTGTLVNPDGSSNPFTLTVQKRSLRFETNTTQGAFTFIREDQRGQSIRQTRTGTFMAFPDLLPVYSSALNIVPALMLLHFRNDPRFAGSLVQAADGSLGLKFVEGPPPGFKPPPFPQPNWWLLSGLIPSFRFKL